MPPLRLAGSALLLGSLLIVTGCVPQQQIAEQEVVVNTLRADIALLEAEIEALHDSLTFYDDIESGQFARDQRLLRDQITELEYRLAIARDGGLPVATLLADDLFEPASATLTDAGRALLDTVADTLKVAYEGEQYRVEGHADNTPLGGSLQERYSSNWELAAARAAVVARYLLDTHDFDPGQLAVVSYGATRPAASNETAQGRLQNRRVRILVLPPCPTDMC